MKRQFSIHPQLDNKGNGSSSVVSQQPYANSHSKHSGKGSEECGLLVQEQMTKDYSPYGSMDDIGAEIGYVDTSMYPGSDITDSLRIPQHEQSPVLARARSRSPSPLPSVLSFGDAGTELRKRALQLVQHSSSEAPCVQFSLYYNSEKLIVHLKQAFKLPTSRPEESSNPFTEVYLLPKKNEVHKSRTVLKTHNPIFDETFKFTKLIPNEIEKQIVVMRMYINERSHFIGGVLYPLESANMDGDLIKVTISEFDEEESLRVRT